jgi:LacI family transcriptional regulator
LYLIRIGGSTFSPQTADGLCYYGRRPSDTDIDGTAYRSDARRGLHPRKSEQVTMGRKPGNRAGQITIINVAKEAGVSYGTVSRVINNDVHVKPETRARVREAMGRLGFVVNRQARVLAGGKSNAIGVLVPDLGTEYIGEIMRGVDAELSFAGYDLLLYTTHRAAAKESNYVADLVRGMVDGLLLVLPRNPVDYIGDLTRRRYPFVLIDHQGTGHDCPSVGASNWQGAYHAAEYLLSLGHRRIGFISGSMDLGAAQDRLEGFRAALRTHHYPDDPELFYEGAFNQPDGYAGALQFLSLENPPTAIFASNDVMAMGVMDALREKGLHIPDDMSVAGCDDIPMASLIHPAITNIRQPLETMGRVAAQQLMEMLKNPEKRIDRIELPTELIIRDSCSSPKGSLLHPQRTGKISPVETART